MLDIPDLPSQTLQEQSALINAPDLIKTEIDSHLDLKSRCNLAASCSSFYNFYAPIRRYYLDLSHPDPLQQLVTLRHLSEISISQKQTPLLRNLLITYTEKTKIPNLLLLAYTNIAILSAQPEDSDIFHHAIQQIINIGTGEVECPEIVRFLLQKIRIARGNNNNCDISTELLNKLLADINGHYNEGLHLFPQQRILYYLALLDADIIVQNRDHLASHLICWFSAQEDERYESYDNMLLNLSFVSKTMPQEELSTKICDPLLASCRRISRWNYGYTSQHGLCIPDKVAMTLFFIQGVNYLEEKIKSHNFLLSASPFFLKKLICNGYKKEAASLFLSQPDFFLVTVKQPDSPYEYLLQFLRAMIIQHLDKQNVQCVNDIVRPRVIAAFQADINAFDLNSFLNLLPLIPEDYLSASIIELIYKKVKNFYADPKYVDFRLQPWHLFTILPTEQYDELETIYTNLILDKSKDSYYLFVVIQSVRSETLKNKAFAALEIFLSQQNYFCNFHHIEWHWYLLTREMQEKILRDIYAKLKPLPEGKNPLNDPTNKSMVDFLVKIDKLEPLIEDITSNLLERIRTLQTDSYQIYGYSSVCQTVLYIMREVDRLIPARRTIFQETFYQKTKIILDQSFIQGKGSSCNNDLKEVNRILLSFTEEHIKNLLHNYWLPALDSNDPNKIECVTSQVIAHQKLIPRTILVNDLIPRLIRTTQEYYSSPGWTSSSSPNALLKLTPLLTEEQLLVLSAVKNEWRDIFKGLIYLRYPQATLMQESNPPRSYPW